MKIRILTALFALVALAACSTNEIELASSNNADDIVGFGTYLSKAATRANVIESFSEEDSFGVFAYYTGSIDFDSLTTYSPNYMYNQAISTTDAGDSWSYTPLKYWPNTVTSDNDLGKVSFFAYYPWVENRFNYNPTFDSNSTMTTPRVKYTASSGNTSYELLWAVDPTTGLACKDRTKESGAVNMQFQHAVARVGMELKLAGDILETTTTSTTITINEVKFGLNSPDFKADSFVSSYMSDYTSTAYASSAALTQTGYLELNNTEPFTPLWSSSSGTFYTTYNNASSDWSVDSIDRTATTTYYDVPAIPIFKGTDPTIGFNTDGTAASVTSVYYGNTVRNRSNRYLMLIPQDVTDVYVYLVYTIEVNDSKIATGTDGGSVTQTLVSAVPFSMGAQLENGWLEGGKAYTYSFTVSLDGVEMSVLDVTDEWDVEIPDENTEDLSFADTVEDESGEENNDGDNIDS